MRKTPHFVMGLVVACLLVLVVGGGGQARANVGYAEGADLGNASATALGAIGVGSNTVQAQIDPHGGIFNQPIQGDTADEFSVTIPADVRVTSITVHIYGYSATNTTQPAFFRCLNSGSVNNYPVNGLATSPNLVNAPDGLLGGTYVFRMESTLVPSGAGSSATVAYIVNLQGADCRAPQPTATGDACSIRVTLPAGGPSVKLLRSPDGSLGTEVATLSAGQTTYVDSVPPGTAYTYRVVLEPASNPCGGTTSYISNPTSATSQLPGQPAPVSNPTDDGCTGLTWTNSNGADEAILMLHNAETGTAIFTVTIPVTQIPYRFPASFNPFPLLGAQKRAFWSIQSRRACGGFVSTAATTFTLDFTLKATVGTPSVTLVNGPCSVLVYPMVDPGAASVTVYRIQLGQPGTMTFSNPAMPYFEDTTAVPGVTYQYFIQAFACNTVGSAFTPFTVQRSPVAGPRPPVRVIEAETATLAAGSPPAGLPYTAAWRRGGVSASDPASMPVVDGDGGGRVSGATTPTLVIQRVGPNDTDAYWCTMTTATACAPVVASVSLFLAEGCRADFDRSGARTIDDIFIYLNAWFAGCP